MRVLFISEHFGGQRDGIAGGTDRRMAMMIDAARRVGPVDFLFFVPACSDRRPASIDNWRRTLAQRWGTDVTLSICPTIGRLGRLSLRELMTTILRSLARGAFSFFTQTVSLRTSSNQQIRMVENCLDRNPTVIVAHRLGAIAPLLLTRRALPPIVFDLDNVEHVKWARIMRRCPSQQRPPSYHWLGVCLLWLRYLLTSPLLLWAEYQALRLARYTFVCSDHDRAIMARWGVGQIVTVPNAVDIGAVGPPVEEPTLLFLAHYGARANVDAAVFMIQEIWPHIHRALPRSRLLIAGRHHERIEASTAIGPGVEILGFVEDLDRLYGRTRVVVCPVRAGSGTRVKILEAAAHGKPVVSTTLGAEGLAMTDGQHILLRDDATEFADACLDLLSNAARCCQIGNQARLRTLELYERSQIVAEIAEHLAAAVNVSRDEHLS